MSDLNLNNWSDNAIESLGESRNKAAALRDLLLAADRQRGLNAIPFDADINPYPDNSDQNMPLMQAIKGLGMSPFISLPEKEQKAPDSIATDVSTAPEKLAQKPTLRGASAHASSEELKNTPQPEEEKSKISGLLERYKQATEKRNSNQLLDSIARASNTIGTAIAGGGRVAADYSVQDAFKPLIDQDLRSVEGEADFTSKASKIANMEDRNNPSSSVSKNAKEVVVSMLKRMNMPSQAANIEKSAMSLQQLEDVFGQTNLNNLLTNFETAQARILAQKQASESKREKALTQDEMKNLGRLASAGKIISGEISRNNTALGRTANIIRSAEAIEQLVDGHEKTLDTRQIYEIASSLDAMLTSGASTVSGRNHLIPKSWSADKSKIAEYLTNAPQSAGQGDFVKRLMETVRRENALAKEQSSRMARKLLAPYADLRKKMPEEWGLLARENGLDPDLFDAENEDSKAPKKSTYNIDQDALEAALAAVGFASHAGSYQPEEPETLENLKKSK